MSRTEPTFSDRLIDIAARGFIGAAKLLPYRWRVPAMGWVVSRIAAPLAGWNRRVRDNLAHVRPDMPKAQVRHMERAVPDNFGRDLIEMYSADEFRERARHFKFQGDGVEALYAARDAMRPVLLITGHFGNYDAPRAALSMNGFPVGGLYNPMANPLFNTHYVTALGSIASPVFERSRRGMSEMIRFLRGGGMVGIVVDQYMKHGEPLDFMGQPAKTALSAAELALKYDALAIPIYGVRQENGLDFDLYVEPPIPHGDPIEMTQAMNDSLARMVDRFPDQWFWVHRRWKRVDPRPE
ncbi:lysophospholipid acyltransferase family protein [Psychromarinibacter sp. S121]|uniref:lysophospholipid acyltransferase family protein n=1 Tax=Psychromarinibacter sp. S121 TaxID=3415127 RepID=UPI003C79E046